MSRFGISRRLGIASPLVPQSPSPLRLLRPLRAVLRAALHSSLDANRVERAAHHVITHARQILDAAAANQHERVFLQVVADARNVSRHFFSMRRPPPRSPPLPGTALFC